MRLQQNHRDFGGHEEGVEQDYCILTKRLSGEKGRLKKLHAVRLEYGPEDPKSGRRPTKEIPNSEFEVDCDLLILAMGFLGPVKKGMLKELGIELNERGNIKTNDHYMTNVDGVFAAGDASRGASLVVHAINQGKTAAEKISEYLRD